MGQVEFPISCLQKEFQTAAKHCDVEVRRNQLPELRLRWIIVWIFCILGGKTDSRNSKTKSADCTEAGTTDKKKKENRKQSIGP